MVLYNHQFRIAWSHLSSDPGIRDRALQCLLPPTILLLTSLAFASLAINKPGVVLWPLKKFLPAMPWTVAATAVALFAIIARPALWEHECDTSPIRINPSDRSQWQEVWLSLYNQGPEELSREYRVRMERDLDEWRDRQNRQGDLEEWINLSSQAAAKRDCLNQKDELFRETWRQKKAEWEESINERWTASVLRELWMKSIFEADVCRPETRGSKWATLMKNARKQLGIDRKA